MKLKSLFDTKVIVSSVTATILAGAIMFYFGAKVPFLKAVSRGYDGNRA